MIINLPSKTDFDNVAKQCLTQAFNIVFELDKELIYYEEVTSEDVWKYHQGDLNTSLILVYQGIEAFLKSKICEKTPLLLLDLKRTEWPSLPDARDKDFNELFTIGGESLIRTYCSVVAPERVDSKLTEFIEEIRLTRNKLIHGVSKEYLDPKYIVIAVLNTFTYFLGKDSWWLTMRELYINNPLFGFFNNEFEEAALIEKLDFAEKLLGTSEFIKHFSLSLKAHRYFCPWCRESLWSQDQDIETKWALLVPPNKEGAKEIKCINCQRIFTVIRDLCSEKDCKGNVLFDLDGNIYCLTCYRVQYEE